MSCPTFDIEFLPTETHIKIIRSYIERAYQAGHTQGYSDGIDKAQEIFNSK